MVDEDWPGDVEARIADWLQRHPNEKEEWIQWMREHPDRWKEITLSTGLKVTVRCEHEDVDTAALALSRSLLHHARGRILLHRYPVDRRCNNKQE